jgi:hypothetical protein
MTHFYAGIGSRQTPPSVCEQMTGFARRLAALGWVLRSGGAIGADQAFERGAERKEIYRASDANEDALRLAAASHPAWDRCSEHARRLLARNTFQVLGPDLCTPSTMVICWTADGKDTGGTAIAIRLAWENKIPVFNLSHPRATARLDQALRVCERVVSLKE